MKRFSDVRRKLNCTPLIIIILFLFNSAGLAYASFTIEDEKKLGKEFYEKLEKSHVLIEDQKVNTYINKLGQKILAQTQNAPFDFKFSVIKSSAINAFATPGGYVYVNSGLINLVDKESELAGILGHEIGHVNARHVADIIEKSQKLNIATLAAVLAGAFLGGGGDVTAAVMGFSLATATSLNLKYSREHEEDADRRGLTALINAGYDGTAMIDFLKKMRRYEFYSNSIPSYFLTHPGTDERIRYLDAVLQTTHVKKGADSIIGNLKRIQSILMLGEKNLEASLNYFQNELKKDTNDADALYGLAVTQDRLGQTSESLANFRRALNTLPDDEDILRDLGILYFKLGQTSYAIQYLRKAFSINQENSETLLYLGRSYESVGDYESALELYKKFDIKNNDDADIYYNLAMAYGKTNNQGASHYNFGIYFKKKKKIESATFHFKEALKYFPEQSERFHEIENEIKSLTPDKNKKRVGSANHDRGDIPH